MALDNATLERLAALKNKPRTGVPRANPAYGPLRHIDTERRCASRGCGSSTNYAVQGVPLCTNHALKELNEMLFNQGFRGVVTDREFVPHPTPIPEDRIICATGRYKLDIGWALARIECIHGIQLNRECGGCGS